MYAKHIRFVGITNYYSDKGNYEIIVSGVGFVFLISIFSSDKFVFAEAKEHWDNNPEWKAGQKIKELEKLVQVQAKLTGERTQDIKLEVNG